jgi:phage terminase large subunit-like protein
MSVVTREVLEQFTTEDLLLMRWQLAWKQRARTKQIPPNDEPWNFYGVLSGRSFGKTLSAANWLGIEAARDPGSYNFVVSPTHDDVQGVCFNGPTGLHSQIPVGLIKDSWTNPPSIRLWNDAYIRGFAADSPERLRGPQCHRAWGDEVASWRRGIEAWDNLIMGLRLGPHPKLFWTGTPKPKPFVKMLVSLPNSIIRRGTTYENRENLTDTFFDNIAKYEGTKIGRQEIYGEIINNDDGGFVKRADWRLWPAKRKLPKFRFIVLSLDTALTEKSWDKKSQTGDPTACSVWGLFTHENKDNIMLLDCWEDHLGMPELIERVKHEKSKTYGDSDEPVLRPELIRKSSRPAHQGRKVDLILIEDITSGKSLRQMLAAQGVLTEPYNPGKLDKLSRLHSVSPCFAHGRVWAVESDHIQGSPKTWADPLITQVCTYVGEGSLDHDDLMDTTSQALRYFMDKFQMRFSPQKSVEEALVAMSRNLNKDRKNPYDG